MLDINVEFFGYVAAILTTLAFLPQLIKTLKTKIQGEHFLYIDGGRQSKKFLHMV